MKRYLLLICFFFILASNAKGETYIRINQIGYPSTERKIAIAGSTHDLSGRTFLIKGYNSDVVEYSSVIPSPITIQEGDTPFIYNHTLEFTKVGKSGLYYVEIHQESKSHPFKVENNPYTGLIDLLLRFMRAARCGNTEPDFHGPCHVHDATNVNLDVTGGWHDAGDYIKFSKKESYVAYLLLLTYAENVQYADQFSDLNNNGLPDVIDEAKIGLDYLLKLYPDEDTFVYRVGDLKWDHRQGMRMPELDKLAKNQRPALIGFDRNNLAKYAYTMALGANVFKDFPQFEKEVETYLPLAERAYEKAIQIGDDHFDKLCLAATELYRVTEKPEYLKDARKFNDHLSRTDGGSYDTNVNFAHARLAPYYDKALSKLRASLALMLSTSDQRAFGYTTRRYLWGSLYRCLSGGSAAWLYESLAGDPTYDVVNRRIRDFTLGVNPWGVCFVSGVGAVYPKNTHGNLPFVLEKKGVLKEAALPGSVALGPVDRSYWEKEWHHLVPTARDDIYAEFQPPDCLYHDHPHDFVTNEPCIYGSAEAILFFSQFMRSRNQ